MISETHLSGASGLPLSSGPFRAIVFDLDGTLYPRGCVKQAMIRRLFPRLLRLKRYTDARNREIGCDYGDAVSMREALLRHICADNKNRCERIRRWLERRYYPALAASIGRIPAREGFPEFVADLHRRGIRMAVVSDYGNVRERLRSLGFDPAHFVFLLGTEEEGMMKPARRILDLILEQFGLEAAEILVVGDRADTDRALAEAGGMGFLGICDTECPSAAGPEWHSWPEFKVAFEAVVLK